MTVALALFIGGLAVLVLGGELLVRGATTVARLAGLTPAVIGLTIVALGTSTPELVVSVLAAVGGEPDIAVGNAIGSNIFNIAIVLGITALVIPLPVEGNAVRLEWPFMVLASFAALLVASDGTIGRLEGGLFVVALALFVAFSVRLARRDVKRAERGQLVAATDAHELKGGGGRPLVAVGAIVAGLLLLVVGGRLMVDGAVAIARLIGMTERVIGLTVVAAGTSAPELVTSLVAAFRGRTDVAVANIIGSNIFNILGILGVAALIQPTPVSQALLSSDFLWMIGLSLLLFPLMRSRYVVTRVEGGVLVAVYGVYVVMLLRA